ncbi:MAG: DUF885 family protein, partial [Bryobacteraceae bacterium]|nr:DUF885 family protein [Bryobacteraceae bacterium]
PFEALTAEAKADYVLFRAHLDVELRQVGQRERRLEEIEAVVPFAPVITGLWEARQRIDPLDARQAAESLSKLVRQIEGLSKELPNMKLKRPAANRAAQAVEQLRELLKRWNGFYSGYDPNYSWWMADPYQKANAALESYAAAVREKLAGVGKGDKRTIVGDPIGREALLAELEGEFIAYTPEELVEIANREFAWCEEEMKKASRELGYGEDWRKALEHVKTLYMPPGGQPEMVRNLAMEAYDYVTRNDLLTVPPLAGAAWRMEMMAPERQRVNPFFLGGEVIQVSYPTAAMTHEEKMMAMRGNNIHFSRSTVFHELIPGHWLQQYMTRRYSTYRRPLATAFWTEGWALYWEMVLWDRGFARGPEDRVGMLFWRMHRCARIIFSLNFHMEKMSPEECVRFLIERGGQEPDNAEAEVRRSFEGDYGPLYQIAYMVGALQFRALRAELVGTGKMGEKEFHDRILTGGSMPVEIIRARLAGLPLAPGSKASWRFYPR